MQMIQFENNAVGRVVKRIRKQKGMSQEVLSGLAELARSHLAMIETGHKQPNFETIWKISNAFNMPPHTLVELIEKEIQKEKNSEL